MNNEQITPMTIKNSTPPPVPPPSNDHPYLDWTLMGYILLSFAAGFLKYSLEYWTGVRNFHWVEGFVYALVSSLSGYIAFALCTYLGFSAGAMGFIAGLAGWSGVKLINKLESMLADGLADRLKQAMLTIFSTDNKDKNKD